jgi:hypothetical protein
MVLVPHLIVIFTAILAHLRPPAAARGLARPAAPTRAATLRLAIVRLRVAARKRQCAGRALGRPVKAPFQIAPEHPARERNRAPLAATRSLGLASEFIFFGHDLGGRVEIRRSWMTIPSCAAEASLYRSAQPYHGALSFGASNSALQPAQLLATNCYSYCQAYCRQRCRWPFPTTNPTCYPWCLEVCVDTHCN